MKMSWLWFLPVLFVASVFSYPLVIWSHRRQKKEKLTICYDLGVIILQIIIFGIWSGVSLSIISE
jgi:hypothetical protein